jgi:hypothetical protein
MIVKELYMTRSDGEKLYRTYSDAGMHIERDGIMYEEAIDPESTNREYTETNVPITDFTKELTPEEALAIITGGEM